VQRTGHDVFAGRKVLLTKSKNNELTWIADWIDYHVRAHEVDAVLIYDNASTDYEPTDILERIRTIPGVAAAGVVAWPYKFGRWGPNPDGTYFTGTYCQQVGVEHGRRRFLQEAAAVVQCDIDELVVSNTKSKLFDELARSPVGAIYFGGVWIENIRDGGAKPPRHRDFRYAGPGVGETKWAAIPRLIPDGVQMMIHDFTPGYNPTYSRDLVYRHFRAISTSWKYARSAPEGFDPAIHQLDTRWVDEMHLIGWLEEDLPPADRDR
jgi:hypothetical protein